MSPWNGLLGFLLLWSCTPDASTSAETPELTTTTDPTVPGTQSSGILVLKSGRVITGKIVDRDGGFDIFQDHGRLFIGSEQVWLSAADLVDAHQMMRDSLPSLTPDDHLRLAHWSAANGLLGTAKREILDALHKDPYREDAKDLLATVVRQQQEKDGAAASSRRARGKAVLHPSQGLPRRSLGGLPPALARDFTCKIQPLMSNKCASCHHPESGREYEMLSIRRGSTPFIAEKNLSSLLRQIDFTDPDSSPLLRAADLGHGQASMQLFGRRNGRRQLKTLTEWVIAVARHADRSVSGADLSPRRSKATFAVQGQSQPGQRPELSPVAVEDPHGLLRSRMQSDAEVLEDAARRNRRDLFDPALFNERFRKSSARLSREN